MNVSFCHVPGPSHRSAIWRISETQAAEHSWKPWDDSQNSCYDHMQAKVAHSTCNYFAKLLQIWYCGIFNSPKQS